MNSLPVFVGLDNHDSAIEACCGAADFAVELTEKVAVAQVAVGRRAYC